MKHYAVGLLTLHLVNRMLKKNCWEKDEVEVDLLILHLLI